MQQCKKADAMRRLFVDAMKQSGRLASAHGAQACEADAQQGEGGEFGSGVGRQSWVTLFFRLYFLCIESEAFHLNVEYFYILAFKLFK